jgi:hypothetical protein
LFGIWYDKFTFCITSFISLAGRWQVIYIFFLCWCLVKSVAEKLWSVVKSVSKCLWLASAYYTSV